MICLSTISPFYRLGLLFIKFKSETSILWALEKWYRAPGHSSPLSTNFFKNSIFNYVTLSGTVNSVAISTGTPNWSNSNDGSGDTTVLDEKSTLFPIKLPRSLPSLPFSLYDIALIGLPPFYLALPSSLFIKYDT